MRLHTLSSLTPLMPSLSSCWKMQVYASSSEPMCVRTRCCSSYLLATHSPSQLPSPLPLLMFSSIKSVFQA